MPDGCFCEAVRDQLVRQPANAVSGLAFVGIGMLILLSRRTEAADPEPVASNPIRSQRIHAILLGVATLVVGIGTTLYHASLTFWAQTLDVLGMYLIATFIVVYNLGRLSALSTAAAATIYGVGNAVLLSGLIAFPQGRRFAFAALVVLAAGLEIAARRKRTPGPRANRFRAALLVLAAGFAIWVADITLAACSPYSWLQGHALWHLAGAAAVWLVFQYYYSAVPGSEYTTRGRAVLN
jgi:hypothetical protein